VTGAGAAVKSQGTPDVLPSRVRRTRSPSTPASTAGRVRKAAGVAGQRTFRSAEPVLKCPATSSAHPACHPALPPDTVAPPATAQGRAPGPGPVTRAGGGPARAACPATRRRTPSTAAAAPEPAAPWGAPARSGTPAASAVRGHSIPLAPSRRPAPRRPAPRRAASPRLAAVPFPRRPARAGCLRRAAVPSRRLAAVPFPRRPVPAGCLRRAVVPSRRPPVRAPSRRRAPRRAASPRRAAVPFPRRPALAASRRLLAAAASRPPLRLGPLRLGPLRRGPGPVRRLARLAGR
jgi:hypothetical protein